MFSYKNFNHITILASDKDESEKFYEDILRFEKVIINGKCLWFKVGNQWIHITKESENPISNTFYHFAVNVDGFSELISHLIRNNIKVFQLDENKNKLPISDIANLAHFFINDPDGNLIEFVDSKNKFFNPEDA